MTIKAERPTGLSPSLFNPTFLLAFNMYTRQTSWHWIDFFQWSAPTLKHGAIIKVKATVVVQSCNLNLMPFTENIFQTSKSFFDAHIFSTMKLNHIVIIFILVELTYPKYCTLAAIYHVNAVKALWTSAHKPQTNRTLLWLTCCHIRYHL